MLLSLYYYLSPISTSTGLDNATSVIAGPSMPQRKLREAISKHARGLLPFDKPFVKLRRGLRTGGANSAPRNDTGGKPDIVEGVRITQLYHVTQ